MLIPVPRRPIEIPGRCPDCGRPRRPRRWHRGFRRDPLRWRRSLALTNMAIGDTMMDTDGSNKMASDGSEPLDDGAGCPSCCGPCCSAASVVIDLSSVSVCTGCYPFVVAVGPNGNQIIRYYKLSTNNPLGIYTLPLQFSSGSGANVSCTYGLNTSTAEGLSSFTTPTACVCQRRRPNRQSPDLCDLFGGVRRLVCVRGGRQRRPDLQFGAAVFHQLDRPQRRQRELYARAV